MLSRVLKFLLAASVVFGTGILAAPTNASGLTTHAPQAMSPDVPASGYKNAAYFVNWGVYGREFDPQQLPASELTHVIYAFAQVQTDGTVKLSDPDADLEKHYPGDSWNDAGHNAYGCTKQLFILKKKHRQMKTLFSIGGWSYRANFPAAASTAASRATFASTAVAFVKDMGFDGIDIDWEYPADDTEAANFVLLLEAVRKELDAYAAESAPGYHFLLTIASPAGPQNYNRLQMTKMDAFLDAWHLMGYDYSGSFSTDSAHGSNLYPSVSNPNSTPFSTSRAITDYIAKGVPPNKIVLGVPLYGHAFESTSGIGQPYTGIGGGSFENGIWDYKALPKAGATMHFNEETSGTYSYDSASHELITFDDVKQANIKADYVKSNGLGGAMYWEASGDKSGSDSIISSIAGSFGNLEQSHNLLSYPASQYDNIANGMPGQ